MTRERIIKQLDMIGKKVDIIAEGYTKDQIEENIDHFIDNEKELLSTCCGWSALGNLHNVEGTYIGLCSKCCDHCDFEEEE
tara:strand:- start:274 stop:516 length:243 start_codon:yes stop_codon:yes gene_type:complete